MYVCMYVCIDDTITSKNVVFFVLLPGQISPSSWESIVSNLKEIRSKSLPFERIDCLLSVAKEIPAVYRFEHPDLSRQQEPDHQQQQQQQQPQSQQQCLGADDILPVFIYILVRAQIPNLLALNQELQTLCDSERRLGYFGWIVCLFGCVLSINCFCS